MREKKMNSQFMITLKVRILITRGDPSSSNENKVTIKNYLSTETKYLYLTLVHMKTACFCFHLKRDISLISI